jgi:hypothetical protein
MDQSQPARRLGSLRAMSTRLSELESCVFCGDAEMTEEHLIAFWAHRAFAKKRKPRDNFRAVVRGSALQFQDGDADLTAKIICRTCNNGWVAQIDHAAARIMRPLIRGQSEVTLDRGGQSAVGAWIYKTALMFDAAKHGSDGPSASLRDGFMTSRLAGAGSIIYMGPALRSRPCSRRVRPSV